MLNCKAVVLHAACEIHIQHTALQLCSSAFSSSVHSGSPSRDRKLVSDAWYFTTAVSRVNCVSIPIESRFRIWGALGVLDGKREGSGSRVDGGVDGDCGLVRQTLLAGR